MHIIESIHQIRSIQKDTHNMRQSFDFPFEPHLRGVTVAWDAISVVMVEHIIRIILQVHTHICCWRWRKKTCSSRGALVLLRAWIRIIRCIGAGTTRSSGGRGGSVVYSAQLARWTASTWSLAMSQQPRRVTYAWRLQRRLHLTSAGPLRRTPRNRATACSAPSSWPARPGRLLLAGLLVQPAGTPSDHSATPQS